MAEEQGARNICLTGGEPLLQPTNAIVRLAQRAVCNLGCTVETFTNGSRRIPAQLTTWSSFVMDWKLAGSGEKFSPEYESNRRANVDLLNVYRHSGTQNSIKFVCKDVDDLHEALDIYEELDLVVWSGNVYFGVVWGGDLKAGDLVDRLLVANPGRNWYLNVQTHNYIFNPQERGR
jgi:organic radical activating enzyme